MKSGFHVMKSGFHVVCGRGCARDEAQGDALKGKKNVAAAHRCGAATLTKSYNKKENYEN